MCIFKKLPVLANFVGHAVEKAAKLVAPVKKKAGPRETGFFRVPEVFRKLDKTAAGY